MKALACSLEQQTDDPLKKLKEQSKGMVTCRICKGDHWTSKCPYKDTLGPATIKELEEQGISLIPSSLPAPVSFCLLCLGLNLYSISPLKCSFVIKFISSHRTREKESPHEVSLIIMFLSPSLPSDSKARCSCCSANGYWWVRQVHPSFTARGRQEGRVNVTV